MDVVFTQVPRLSPEPLHGLALMQTIVQQAGLSSSIYDWNIKLYEKYFNTPIWEKFETFGLQYNSYDRATVNLINQEAHFAAAEILEQDPKFVGISVFTIESQKWAKFLAYNIRKLDSSVKIIVGGRGLVDPGESISTSAFLNELKTFNMVDHIAGGDAEHSILQILQGKPYHEDGEIDINEIPLTDYTSFWRPEYEKFSMAQYNDHDDFVVSNTDKNTINVKPTFTRGCVKNCTFCDISSIWPKFISKDGVDVANELIHYYQNFDIKTFIFPDAMINSSHKEFRKFLHQLSNFMEKNDVRDLKWGSQFGIKPKSQFQSSDFELIHQTNGEIIVGVDHVSNNVLEMMNKKYTVDDIDSFLYNASQHKLKNINLMWIVGFINEFEKDHELMVQKFNEYMKFKHIFKCFNLGALLNIPTESPLRHDPKYNLSVGNNEADWICSDNPGLTMTERLKRRYELQLICDKNNLPTWKKKSQWIRMKGNWDIAKWK